MRKIIPLLLVSTFLFSGVLRAEAQVDAAGADVLKKEVTEDLTWRSNMTKIIDQGILVDGTVAVETKKDYYEVHLPHLYMVNKQGKLDVGIITAQVLPGTEKGTWQIRQADIPLAMTYFDAKGIPIAKLTVGNQKFAATWVPAKAMFPKIDSLFQNIKVTGVGSNAGLTARITALKSLITLTDNGDGTWSGPADFGAAGLSANLPGQNPVTASIGEIASKNKYDHLDMSQSMKMKDLAESTMKTGLPQTDDQKKDFIAKLLTKAPFTANGLETTFELSHFDMHDAGTKQQPQQDVALDQFNFTGQTSNLSQDKSKFVVKTTLNGLHVAQVSSPFGALLPSRVDAEIVLDNVPVSKLSDQFFNILTDQATLNASKDVKDTKDPMAQKVAQAEVQKKISDTLELIPGILQQAGTSLAVNNTFIQSDAVTTRVLGKVDASTDARLGASGKATITFKGLNEFIDKVHAVAVRPGSDPHMMSFLFGLMAVQMKSTQSKGRDGISIDNMNIELKKNGDIIVNGLVLNTQKQDAPVPPTTP